MKTVVVDGTIESAYGNKLATPVEYSKSYEEFETYQEVEAEKELPDNDEIVKWANVKRRNNARQKAMQDALDKAGIKKPEAKDPKVIFQNLVKQILLTGQSEDAARKMASQISGYNPDSQAA